jgi:hypothetical protein
VQQQKGTASVMFGSLTDIGMRNETEFDIKGDTAYFQSDGSHPNNVSWQMSIADIAVIALELDDIPDYGYTETIIFINKERQIFKVDIDKVKDKTHFNPFWKAVNERLRIDLDYRREFNPYFVKVVYPNQLYGERLFQPWTITSWPTIILHYLSHLHKFEKRKLNQVVIQYLNN